MQRIDIVVGATFTADPLGDFAPLWSGVLGVDVGFSFTPFGQLHQQLLSADSVLRNSAAHKFVFVRWSDLAQAGDMESAASELTALLNGSGVTAWVVLFSEEADPSDQAANRILRSGLDPRFGVVEGNDIFALYGVASPFDETLEKTASIPFSMEGYGALSAAVVRRSYAAMRPPVKMVAVDCDDTLWDGVVGEDGVDGIRIGAGRQALQRRLSEQASLGRIVALLSKNDARDVDAVFSHRADMALALDDVLAREVNWRSKSENLSRITEEFGVGDDSVVFIDDNLLEIAEVNAAAPAVIAAAVPKGDAALVRFADHFWPFDGVPATKEDLTRTRMYREEAKRREQEKSATSLQAFIDSLDLDIDIAPAEEQDAPRLSQLTQRTNQFNLNLRRLTEEQLREWRSAPYNSLYRVSVRDRFGDYGIVGAIGVSVSGGDAVVELFLLSCRALGRGVEHRMAAFVGENAQAQGLSSVTFAYQVGPRNKPARTFLDALSASPSIAPQRLASTVFAPEAGKQTLETKAAKSSSSKTVRAVDWSRITGDLATGAGIASALAARLQRKRPSVPSPFVAPSPGLERDIADIWAQVLGVSPIGVRDPFTALGGASLHLVRVHSMLSRILGRDIELTMLFECATIEQLALRLQAATQAPAAERAAFMRGARSAHGRRLKAAREGLS